MKHGYGAPLINIYHNGSKVSSSSPVGDSKLIAKVVDFMYKFSEKEDDTCQIALVDSYNPNLPDDPAFQEGSILVVSWGYIGGDMSEPRKVAIRDISIAYTATEIRMELLCTDVASRIKIGAKKKIHKDKTVAELAQEVAEENGLKFNNQIDIDVNYRRPGYIDSGAMYANPVDNTSVRYRGQWIKHEEIVQANKTDSQVLNEYLEKEPGGPYELVGRDDELILKYLTLSGAPLKKFIYGGSKGELLSFTPETKARTKASEATQVNITFNNPEDKSFGVLGVGTGNTNMPALGTVEDAQSPSQGGLAKTIEKAGSRIKTFLTRGIAGVMADALEDDAEYYRSQQTPLNRYRNAQREVEAGNLNGQGPEITSATNQVQDERDIANLINSKAGDGKRTGLDQPIELPDWETASKTIAKGKYGLVPIGQINNSSISEFKEDGNYTMPTSSSATPYLRPPYNREIDSSAQDPKEAAEEAKNKQAKAAMDKNPAEAKVIGNPFYISGKLYEFDNVSNKFSGRYYAIESTHTIGAQGYFVDLTLHRNAQNSTGKAADLNPSKQKVDSKRVEDSKMVQIDNNPNNVSTREGTPELLIQINSQPGADPTQIPIVDVPIITIQR